MGTSPFLVPKWNLIPGTPRLSTLPCNAAKRVGIRSLRPKTLPLTPNRIPYRTQEVVGSSPTSSIDPITGGASSQQAVDPRAHVAVGDVAATDDEPE